MKMMNSKQRIMAAVNGEAVDKIPVVPQITYFTADICDVTWEQAMNDPESMAVCLHEGHKHFGYDGVYAGWESSFNLMASALGAHMAYRGDSIPYIDKPLFTKPEDIHKMKVADPYKDQRLSLHLKATSILRQKLDSDIPVFSYVPGPLTVAGLVIENDNLMKSVLRNPSFVHEVVKLTTQAAISYAQAKIENGAEIIVIADPIASGSMISPEIFDQFSKPYLRAVIEKVYEKGAVPSIHICGNIIDILESLCEMKPKIIEIDFSNDLKKAREIVADRVCLQGNLDPTGTLLMGDKDKVYNESRKALEEGVLDNGYFILSSGCEVPNKTPPENIEAMMRAREA